MVGGFAGTGKTTIVSHLVNTWSRVAVAALCGKAAHVLRQKGAEAKTIHSLIYSPYELNGKIHFRRKTKVDASIFVIDEASMIDHLLLQDLLWFGIPVLFIGDHGQLEPIGTNPNLMKEPKVKLVNFHDHNPGHDIHYGLNGDKLASLGWKSPVSFEDSMKTTIEWQQAHPEWL